jgi:hypothetical protein
MEVSLMKQTVIRTCLGLAAGLALAAGISIAPAAATNIGTLAVGTPYSDTITSSGPTFANDYTFHLDGTSSGVTVLGNGQGQHSGSFNIDSITVELFDSASHLLASATGTTLASFDSFAQSGSALGAGDYLFKVFGDVHPGKSAFVLVSLAANNVAATPIPAAGLMLLTGLGVLGGVAVRRRSKAGRQADAA